MKDQDGTIIYIGKAKDIKKRVNSYWVNQGREAKAAELVPLINDVDFIVTDNEVEALLLEAKLIRQQKPRFNIELKDSLRYAYLKVTDEVFPRIVVARKIGEKGRYYGPYTSGKARNMANRLIQRIFKIRICNPLPKKACLLYHLGQCTAPCIKKTTVQAYQSQIDRAEMLLQGKTKELLTVLEQEMRQYARQQNFEQAQIIKEQIRSIQHISEKQKVDLPKCYDQNVINYIETGSLLFIQVFQIKRGTIVGRGEFRVNSVQEPFPSFIKQYYFLHAIPKEVILPEYIEDASGIAAYLSHIKGNKVTLTTPKMGYKKQLLNMVKKNIELKLTDEPMKELRQLLELPRLPREIDCFDISNTSGTFATGSCVHFSDGKPNKNLYRHFKIESVKGINDFAMLMEVLERRYENVIRAEQPDLVVIDGGKGQLNVALGVFDGLKLDIPAIGLAKKKEEIHTRTRSEPIRLPKSSLALKLIQHLRDEAHRFAITYHKQLRSKAATTIKK